MDDSGNVGVLQDESVVHVRHGRLVGEAGGVQDTEQPVTAAVSGEHATGAVRPMRRGCESDDVQPCGTIAQAGHRLPPILLVTVSLDLFVCHALPMCDQSRTVTAITDPTLELSNGSHGCQV